MVLYIRQQKQILQSEILSDSTAYLAVSQHCEDGGVGPLLQQMERSCAPKPSTWKGSGVAQWLGERTGDRVAQVSLLSAHCLTRRSTHRSEVIESVTRTRGSERSYSVHLGRHTSSWFGDALPHLQCTWFRKESSHEDTAADPIRRTAQSACILVVEDTRTQLEGLANKCWSVIILSGNTQTTPAVVVTSLFSKIMSPESDSYNYYIPSSILF